MPLSGTMTSILDDKKIEMTSITPIRLKTIALTIFFVSFSLILFELMLTRLFGVILFAQFAHLALGLALLGISIGSVIQYLKPDIIPEDDIEAGLSNVVLLMCLSMIVAVICSVVFPVTDQSDVAPSIYQERSAVSGSLLNVGWFTLLLPFLTAPFVFAGIAFSGSFFRLKTHIGLLYGSDLVGGALGAAVFIPLLLVLTAPDTVFFAMAILSLSAGILLFRSKHKIRFITAATCGGICTVLVIIGLTGHEVIKVKYAAGYSESNVSHTKWTPLTRLAVHQDSRGIFVLLDNSSASEVLLTEEIRESRVKEINRSFVYQLHQPPARTIILASSAGPEVAVAQHFGYTDIDAVDIAGEIAEVVRTQFPDGPVNPFVIGNTRQINADGRAAVLHAKEPYDIIQMVHANLHSNAGLLANAWSPSLLETREAFETYLDKLSDNGTISFGRGGSTPGIAQAAAAALKSRGVTEPWRHIAYLTGSATFILVKKNLWNDADLKKLRQLAKQYRCKLLIDPGIEPDEKNKALLSSSSLLTDNKPYLDTFGDIVSTVKGFFSSNERKSQLAINSLYTSLAAQTVFILLAGVFFLFIPLLSRNRAGLTKIKGVGWGLAYVSCLGYGYLAVETVLIHELILFIGHPTYAVTAVILAMLLSSGIGSIVAGMIPQDKLIRILRIVITTALILGVLQAWFIPKLLYQYGLGWPMIARFVTTCIVLTPLGFVMGMPFPIAMRVVPASASGLVPWAWALNGWMSVIAGLSTMILSRIWGYSEAFGIALIFYVAALALTGTLRKIKEIE